jgi:hypothetical protein
MGSGGKMNLKFVLNSNYTGAAAWICIELLSKTLPEMGYTAVKSDFNNYKNYDVAIFMSPDAEIDTAKAQNPEILVGIADPKLGRNELIKKPIKADFLMVSSVEQRDIFLKYNPNVFIFYMLPDIPEIRKKHKDNKKIILGHHGNKVHLEAFYPKITSALSTLAKKYEIELWAMYNIEALGKWDLGVPEGVEVKHIQWKEENYVKYMSKVDIGLSPNNLPQKNIKKLLKKGMITSRHFNYDENDYLTRYKYSSGPARIYIFSQFHIPVVSDFYPSAAQFIMDGKCGYLAHSPEGWYYALDHLCSNVGLRQDMGDALFTHFNNIASRETVISNFVDYVKKIKENGTREEIEIVDVQKPNFFIYDLRVFARKAFKYPKALWNKSNKVFK